MGELLLQIIVEAILFAEENNATLRDCTISVPVCVPPSARPTSEIRTTRDESLGDGVSRNALGKSQKLTGNGKLFQELIGIGSLEPLLQVCGRVLSPNDRSDVKGVILVKHTLELERLFVT